ncbi:conserved protein of unknown function [Tepidanaerobacter acetatoxydans Re1]|uniref:Uncharacterized protein n=1 Tax=Tepidanaerobacter acetatoxydans (strain DSM 21804 / JCM 16047 / Re1) TaxID=1209989 RepID=F4LS85_TEPAE|nr:hypothetical protein [Tepidanaerobacter acetatoxydans]AEE90348.1 hypothetical protein TepRe1_0139 [Tepidanaerobacter acetatoxydans Re1]CCP24838.1 conserved protein of unknown function [Tepidanaerobacter acetatoxydans Re1]
MGELTVRFIKQGTGPKQGAPINIALIDKRDVEASGKSLEDVIHMVAKVVGGPVGINVFDMDAVTTTSDGLVVEGAIITMAAGDIGKVHKEFGILHMEEMEVTHELIKEEPHLVQWEKYYKGKKLFRGPDPNKKLIPVHNVVMTGKAVNNNSATEMMNAVTMEEILLPILGQLQIMKDEPIVFGLTGEVISVGIGMTVAEKYGRVFPTRQFRAGDTAHGSGEYAKTLKANIPCIVAPKSVLAGYIIQALDAGMIPGLHIGCSPAVLAVANAKGAKIALDKITEKAKIELKSVGVDVDHMKPAVSLMTNKEIIEKADDIIPGVVDPVLISSSNIVTKLTLSI